MLARYLRVIPVRYAAQDTLNNLRLAMALRNLLHVQTRAGNLPYYADVAQQLGELHHPASSGLLQDVFQHHDPRALGVLSDLLEEQTGQQRQGNTHAGVLAPLVQDVAHPTQTILSHLHYLQSVMGDPARRFVPAYHNLHQTGSVFPSDDDTEEEVDQKLRLRQAVRQTADSVEGPVYDLMRHVSHSPYFQQLRQARSQGLGGIPRAVLNLYDVLHNLSLDRQGTRSVTHPAHVPHVAGLLRDSLSNEMNRTLIPAIEDYR